MGLLTDVVDTNQMVGGVGTKIPLYDTQQYEVKYNISDFRRRVYSSFLFQITCGKKCSSCFRTSPLLPYQMPQQCD